MIRTASPCCQSDGAKNRPQMSPMVISTNALTVSHGSTVPASRRKRPGLAKRCRLRRGGAREEVASTVIRFLGKRV